MLRRRLVQQLRPRRDDLRRGEDEPGRFEPKPHRANAAEEKTGAENKSGS